MTGEAEHIPSGRGLPTDLELMTRVQEGNEAAFEMLVRRHEDRVFHLAVRVLGSRDEARDAAQEVFIRLWDNPRAWKPTALFTTWLYRVTLNLALSRRRALKLKSLLSLSEVEPDQVPLAPNDSPETHLIRDEESRRLAAEFSRLPPRQRAALHLRYREGLPVAQVARAMGVSLKSAESLIFRGKQALKSRLGDR